MTDDTWLCADAYAYLDDLPLAGLSWEFLRRNPDYQSDFERAKREEASGGAAAVMTAERAHAWGLVFPGEPRSIGIGTAGLLAA